jgi:hypothetical protein
MGEVIEGLRLTGEELRKRQGMNSTLGEVVLNQVLPE